jgi:hypothetical protein
MKTIAATNCWQDQNSISPASASTFSMPRPTRESFEGRLGCGGSRWSGQSVRSDDCSGYDDGEEIGEVPGQPPQKCVVPTVSDSVCRTNNSHCPKDEAERDGGHHFASPGRKGHDETDEQERKKVRDINAGGCEEQICAEVMLEELLVSLNHGEYRTSDQWSDKFPQTETSDDRGRGQQRGSANATCRKVWDGFDRLPPIPISGRSQMIGL